MQYTKQFYEDNLKGYKDPETYDLENTWGKDDDFYLDLAKKSKGKVLDLACGTGRLTIAIHNNGIDVTGLDIMPEMLRMAKQKSVGLNIDWIEADCRNFKLPNTFDLALMTSNGFQYLLTEKDQVDFFKSVNKHLNEKGLCAFEIRNAQKMEYGAISRSLVEGEFKHWQSITNSKNEEIKVHICTNFNEETKLDHIIFKCENVATKNIEISEEYLRYTEKETLNGLLNNCGFKIIHQYGFWDKIPFTKDSLALITICEKVSF